MHQRLVAVGGQGVRVRRLGGDRAGEMRITRFLRNDAVSLAEIIASVAARTAERVAGRHVLAIQDTSDVRREGRQSIAVHPTIAVDADSGALLGLVHADFLTRRQSGRSPNASSASGGSANSARSRTRRAGAGWTGRCMPGVCSMRGPAR